jgi:hypothetical protein
MPRGHQERRQFPGVSLGVFIGIKAQPTLDLLKQKCSNQPLRWTCQAELGKIAPDRGTRSRWPVQAILEQCHLAPELKAKVRWLDHLELIPDLRIAREPVQLGAPENRARHVLGV